MSFSTIFRLLSCSNQIKSRAFSTQQIGVTSIADVLHSQLHKNNGNVEKSLSMVKTKLDSKCVSEVLSRCYPKQCHLGVRFFIWSGLQSGYRHSAYMYRKACKLLNIEQNPQIILDVIESYEAEGSFVTSNMFKVIMKLCKEAQLADVALRVLRKMEQLNLPTDTTMYNVIMRLCCKKGDVEMAKKLMREMGLKDLLPDMITYMTMIEGFCNVGRFEDAFLMLKEMRGHGCFPNSVVYSALLNGLCRFGSMERALELLGEMEKDCGNCNPNVVTYTSIIQSFCKKGQWAEALSILDRMKAFGCSANHVTVSTLVECFCAENSVEEVYRLIDKLVLEHNVSYGDCYNSLVIALARMKKLEAAEKLFREMLAGAVKPDSLASTLLIRELCMEDRVLDGFFLLDEIENQRFSSSIDCDIYSILLVGLCRQGHTMEAAKLARIMLKKSIVLRSPYDDSITDILKNTGHKNLLNYLTSIQKGH